MPLPIINTISFTLLGVTIPVFIFAVTLLGNAINKAQQEENKAKEQEEKDFELKITDLENKINAAKETRNSSQLESQLKIILADRKKFNKQVKTIRNKYSLIELKKCILFPASFFILSILTNEITSVYFSPPAIAPIFWILSVSFLSIGIFRLFKSLSLIQEVSVSSEELQMKKMTEAFSIALEAHDKKKQEELAITFRDIDFPYKAKPDEELTINFRVGLKKGRIVGNVAVWFFVPEEFGLISPAVDKSWRQGSDFVPPNIRTVKVEIGRVSIGPYTPRTLKIKCPHAEGEYFLLYKIYGDGCESEKTEAKIIIGEVKNNTT